MTPSCTEHHDCAIRRMAEMRDALEELVSIVKLVHDHPVIENRILDRAVRKAEDVLR